ncbi:MAG TPA: amino acid adenylation domain-containing protein, partial [Pyrinomonadaceae bacterium]
MTNSEQHLSDSPLLTEPEKHQLLVEWNNTKRDYQKDKCIHELFEEQVERTPDAVALVFEDQQLNYRELNRRGNQLAHYLRKLGVGPEVLVGICLERSLEMVVGLLGILKAGGAYVPLDPTYPKKRLEFMLEDSGTPVLLTQQRLFDGVAAHSANVVCLDRDWKDITRQSEENADSEAKPANLAYVIYTSGSTGNPKGVMNIHRGICNRLLWMQDTYHLTEADRVLQKTPFSFDVSAWEFFWPLIAGARLIVARPEGHGDAAYLVKLISEQQITTVHFVPSMLRIFLEEQGLERCNCLRHVICSGEALPLEVQERFFARLDAALYNLYGPTEASIDVTFWACKRESDQRIVPIGRPIANMQIYLLDSHLQPVPIGVPGELHIGGVGLARGYLNRAELTAEKFIPNPFPEEPGARLYRTGDIARYLPDGNIEFLGRIDNQVKIRGFRIELGEVEAALSRHPAVRESVVVAREDMYAEKRLAAYVVLNQAQTLAVNDLRSFLKAKLPEYMVPSAFVTLESLPLMPNGKIDRRALPASNRVEPPLEEVFVAPRTPTEHRLAKIWAEVLGVVRVGANDDFFALGGESLKATRVIARVLDLCGAELTHRCFFEAPILSALAERIDSSQPGPPNMRFPFIESANADATVPLSWGQSEIWLMAQLETTLPIYNEPFTIYMNGPVNSLALEKALNEIVRRHKILRTAFTIKESDPVQIIQDGVEIKLSVADLRMVAEPDRKEKAIQLCTAEARRPFDLTEPPLVRAMLVRMSETDSRLYLTVHHIVADAYSIYNVLIPELWQLYESIRARKPFPLPELPVQYADYARWQHRWLQGEELEKHLTYWRNQLDGVLPLGLPTDRPRSRVRTFNGAYQSFALSKELTNALSALSRREGVTLYMLLLAAFKTLLWRHSQQSEIVIGTAEAGRSCSEFEPLLGHFMNILVLRTQVVDDPSFRQFLRQVREVTLEAYAHRHVPFAKLVEELELNRGTSRHPLFQVAFIMEPPMACHESGWIVSQLDIQTGTSKFDLTLELEERSEAIIGRFEYNTDLFNATTIERAIAHLQTLLEGIVANPDQRICNLPILTTAERHQLLVEWNDTEKDYPKDQLIHELFEEQVKRTPDAVAVVFEGQELSYRELNAKANQLAHYLKERGVGPEVPVGICLERSLDMVVGLLSILKAGGAYIPLDPQYPSERLAVMLKDSHAPLLLTRQHFVERLSAYAGQAVCLDTDWEEICRQLATNPDGAGTADNLAYVIFTSGSTGQPRGVSITHQAIARLLINTDYIQIEPSDAIAQISNCAFDAATFEIWGALLHGARLVVIPTEVAISPADFAECLNRHRISVLFVTTALFNQLVQRNPTIFRDLRHVLFGGEAVDPKWVRKILQSGPPARLVHVYGPTETTTFATWHEIKVVSEDAVTIPIGRPIANTRVYILDSHLQPVPIGVAGELYIGGDGLARGYLNSPELTAEKFVSNPFRNERRATLYKTGDLARYLRDGNIEFLGRIDNQVKLRGHRIELGEIEAALGQHPAVRDNRVVMRDRTSGDKRLVAYIVPQRDNMPSSSELRRYLKGKLPQYMVPSAFMTLEAFPLTTNGKLDYNALPPLRSQDAQEEVEYVAPQDETERVLCRVWSEVLGIDRVGLDDDFFASGGHSLLA